MDYITFITDAFMHCVDALALLFIVSIGLVVCGFIAEYFAERKKRIQHDETLLALRLQRQFKE
ncbi:hypothetical protein [Klebsiella quasipneumoniae]|uniref:hypothetical protein n=1 Tax=Klebsiella quasipneumoniae TaxID=1463165 RepID=UPI00070FAE3C|nr:hypothetical protein [Klebsiella quasipneumoniae]